MPDEVTKEEIKEAVKEELAKNAGENETDDVELDEGEDAWVKEKRKVTRKTPEPEPEEKKPFNWKAYLPAIVLAIVAIIALAMKRFANARPE
jgi:cytochrome c-type biogenesis protein CcmH/NrfG